MEKAGSTEQRAPDTQDAQRHQFDAEHRRIDDRRRKLDLGPSRTQHWAVALSGGGIRSATFCLGVMQALARARAPHEGPKARDDKPVLRERLLARFDYLSTVSGGGYLGSFIGSLFVPERLRGREKAPDSQVPVEDAAGDAHVAAAENAYDVLDYEPPGRIHTSIDYSTQPVGAAPLAWLRENGRYLTPAGAGDLFYFLALSMRNLLALHMVIGFPLLCALAFFILIQVGLSHTPLCSPLGVLFPLGTAQVICGSLWWMPGVVLLFGVLPLMLAFWMIYSLKSESEPVRLVNRATGLYLAAALVLLALAFASQIGGDLRALLLLGSAICGVGLGYCWWLCRWLSGGLRSKKSDPARALTRQNTVSTYRVLVTRRLASALILTLVAGFFALIPWLSEWIYLWAHQETLISGATALPVLIAAVRMISAMSDDKAMPGWLSRLPISVIAGLTGVTIFLLVALFWGLLAQFVRYSGVYFGDSHDWVRLLVLTALAGIASLAAGQFIGFLNLSSLQSFYRARLARAYLGASNGKRFSGTDRKMRKRLLSVAETLPGDDLPIEDYYRETTCGPVHLINVTLNQTVDPAEQLVQRDRKGKPLCLAPSGVSTSPVSYILDGDPRTRASHTCDSEIYQSRSLAHWVATSGAAFTTGLGRATSLGTSLALGLTNVRLGTWWPAEFLQNGEKSTGQRARRDNLRERAFPTQHYLFYELTAHFHGLNRDFQYLSDGGHFENTATYELIREGRDVELIVMCDCGADQNYQFDDLANLIRLARIDQALEISEDLGVFANEQLAPYFGRLQDFRPQSKEREKPDYKRCAVLLEVKDRRGRRTARILVLKPNLVADLPVDVINYASEHPTFPNESTINQFFDEAQFESYRQLGLKTGQRLFGNGKDDSPVAQALWKYLAESAPAK